MFSIIAAIGKKGELGKNNGLCFHLKEDMKFFRETTTGHKVVMGYNTWRSLPGKLKNRENFVISHIPVEGADQTITDLSAFIKKHQDTPEEIFIIGGGKTYADFLPYAKTLYLTEINASDPDATVFFPKFAKSNYHKTLIKKGSENDLTFSIFKYSK